MSQPVNPCSSAEAADQRQVEQLCDNLGARLESARAEQELLARLVAISAPTRRFTSRQYQALLSATQQRAQQFRALLQRYCHPR